MKIRLFYFAKAREMLGIHREEIDVASQIKTIADLIVFLKGRGDQWQSIFGEPLSLRAAVNQELVGSDFMLSANDEVAFFPPITGG